MKRQDLKPGTVFKYIDPYSGRILSCLFRIAGGVVPEHFSDVKESSCGPGNWCGMESDVVIIWQPEETAVTEQKPILTTDKKLRKESPIARGVLGYFPRAMAAIANVSYVGNEQHNPGQPMHWAKEKSNDHADCIVRHLIEAGTVDEDGLRHTAKAAWRALALLETELEALETK